jgi:UDP-glucose 4-epimerase
MNIKSSYFLIGGSGFLGGAFADFLAAKNIPYHKILRGDISDAQSFHFNKESLLNLPISNFKNIIIDFAYTSIPGTSFSDPVKDFSENLYNINSHLAFASHLPNAMYIYISSGGTVYGNVNNEKPINEEASNFPLSPYGITKLASEKYALMYRQIYGLDVKIVRPANIYGPGQKPYRGQGFVATAIAKVLKNESIQIFGNGNIIRDYLFVDDFCSAIFNIINEGTEGEIYNLGSSVGLTINQILSQIGKLQLNPIHIDYLPGRPFDVKYNVLESQKLRELNWEPTTTIDKGLVTTAKWVEKYIAQTGK